MLQIEKLDALPESHTLDFRDALYVMTVSLFLPWETNVALSGDPKCCDPAFINYSYES